MDKKIFIGTDSGATTSKIGAVWEDGTPVTTDLLQRSTNSNLGKQGVLDSWLTGISDFLVKNSLHWDQVQGVGLAMPAPFLRYGVVDKAPNMPSIFEGWDVHSDFSKELSRIAHTAIQLAVGNDGNYGGVAEAQRVRGETKMTVLMLAPGSGLGGAYIGSDGLPLEGDHLAGMELGHMPAVLQNLDTKPYPCGCGRDWGCVEVYTAISGLPYLLEERRSKFPNHFLFHSDRPVKEKVLELRGLAQHGDELAMDIFDFQAKVMGFHVANLYMSLDPGIVVIGGGLMDPFATTQEFRDRYIRIVVETAIPYLWKSQQATIKVVPATLGDLSQAIGSALVALYKFGN